MQLLAVDAGHRKYSKQCSHTHASTMEAAVESHFTPEENIHTVTTGSTTHERAITIRYEEDALGIS
jgi:hypothetical protein